MQIPLLKNLPFEDENILEFIRNPEKKEYGYRLLVKKYQERLYYHIRNLVKTHENTDDVLQNTFVKIFKNIDSFENKSSLFTWIYRIATNECINYLQKENKYNIRHISNGKTQYDKAENAGMDAEKIISNVEKAIETLPDKQKLVFHLRYYDEMPYEQIAEITNTSVGSLKASYHHAVKKMETYIKEMSGQL
ncbi:MAG: RNA polymerase sigma factor [Saprospiraceae bacterium]|nr:RNA polymerase sigma factor [Saprospiraceae bacterium]